MIYQVQFSKEAESDLIFHKKSGNKVILKKIVSLLKEISNTPYEGTGKPEALKHELTGKWSRRINLEHRLVYEIINDQILVHSAKSHY